ncbi:MAG: type II secretion system minor pseudopilin GspK [Syntrophobacterales bacterium]|jgi:general secretion pathway protein K
MKGKKVGRQNKQSTLGQRGAALILVLLMVSILVVLVLETMRAMQVEGAGARHFRDSLQAEGVAKSGVSLAISLLAKDLAETEVDHPGEPWAQVAEADALPVQLPEDGTLEGKVVDEASKFPINYLVDKDGKAQDIYQKVLTGLLTNKPFQLEEEVAQGLVQAITDWLDRDDETAGEFGAETIYYQQLEHPYECKNGPFTSLAELQLVRGMTEALYFGAEENPGLRDLLTVYGNGKININTATPLILRALVSKSVSEDTAEAWAESVVAYREEPMHWDFLAEPDWYRNRMAGFNDISLPAELVATQSNHFSAKLTGKAGVGRKSIFACLERTKSEREEGQVTVSIRYWEVY